MKIIIDKGGVGIITQKVTIVITPFGHRFIGVYKTETIREELRKAGYKL